MYNPTTVEIGDNDSIVITKDGKVVGFVRVKRDNGHHIELVGHPVNFHNWDYLQDKHTFNSFGCSGEVSVDTPEEFESFANFVTSINA